MIGVVQKIEFTKNGSKKLQIGGMWYFAGKVNVEPVKVGDKIDFTFSEFGEDRGKGRLKGLQDWKPVTNPTTGAPETGSTITEADVLRTVSNIVGNACAAGVVKTPQEIDAWISAAHRSLLSWRMPPKRPAAPDPEFNDDLPPSFYENENPAPRNNGSEPGW